MKTIIYQNQYGKQFNEDMIFNNLLDTKNFLINRGFKEEAQVFYKTSDWGGITKAFIKHLRTQ